MQSAFPQQQGVSVGAEGDKKEGGGIGVFKIMMIAAVSAAAGAVAVKLLDKHVFTDEADEAEEKSKGQEEEILALRSELQARAALPPAPPVYAPRPPPPPIRSPSDPETWDRMRPPPAYY